MDARGQVLSAALPPRALPGGSRRSAESRGCAASVPPPRCRRLSAAASALQLTNADVNAADAAAVTATVATGTAPRSANQLAED